MKKLAGIDGMRAIACLMIVFHHLFQLLPYHSEWVTFSKIHRVFLSSAPAGVSIFFVLSGLLLSLPFWESYLDNNQLPKIPHYFWRRAARIIPGFYLVLIVSFIVQTIFAPHTPYSWQRFISGFTFLNGFYYVSFFPVGINAPLWSISFEVVSYILLPLIMVGLFKWPGNRKISTGLLYWCIALFFVFLVNHYIHIFFQTDDLDKGWEYGFVGGAKLWMPDYNPIGFFAHFAVGIFAAGLIAFMRRNNIVHTLFSQYFLFDMLTMAGFIAAFSIMWTQRNYSDSFNSPLTFQSQPFYYPFFTVSVALIVVSAPFSSWIRHVLDNRFFVYTAKISYGLYLWHYLLRLSAIYFFAYYYQGTFMEKNNSVIELFHWALISGVTIVSAYVIASASWFFFEKPILNYKRSTKITHQNGDEKSGLFK